MKFERAKSNQSYNFVIFLIFMFVGSFCLSKKKIIIIPIVPNSPVLSCTIELRSRQVRADDPQLGWFFYFIYNCKSIHVRNSGRTLSKTNLSALSNFNRNPRTFSSSAPPPHQAQLPTASRPVRVAPCNLFGRSPVTVSLSVRFHCSFFILYFFLPHDLPPLSSAFAAAAAVTPLRRR